MSRRNVAMVVLLFMGLMLGLAALVASNGVMGWVSGFAFGMVFQAANIFRDEPVTPEEKPQQ